MSSMSLTNADAALALYDAELRRLRGLMAAEFAHADLPGVPILLNVRVVRGS